MSEAAKRVGRALRDYIRSLPGAPAREDDGDWIDVTALDDEAFGAAALKAARAEASNGEAT